MIHKIDVQDNGNTEFETLNDLLNSANEWYDHDTKGIKIELQLFDINGKLVYGDATTVVGICGSGEDSRFIITGNIKDID